MCFLFAFFVGSLSNRLNELANGAISVLADSIISSNAVGRVIVVSNLVRVWLRR